MLNLNEVYLIFNRDIGSNFKKMEYSAIAYANSSDEGAVLIGENRIAFGVSKVNTLPSPADLLVSAFAACCLKNVERFSEYLHYQYSNSEIKVDAKRSDKPPMIDEITFTIRIRSEDERINTDLLLRNLQKFGTIYNTLNAVCKIEGEIILEK